MGASSDNRLYIPAVLIQINHALNGDEFPCLDNSGVGNVFAKNLDDVWQKTADGGLEFPRWQILCHKLSTLITLHYNGGSPMIRRSQMYAFEQSVNKLAQALVDDKRYWSSASADVAINYRSELTSIH